MEFMTGNDIPVDGGHKQYNTTKREYWMRDAGNITGSWPRQVNCWE